MKRRTVAACLVGVLLPNLGCYPWGTEAEQQRFAKPRIRRDPEPRAKEKVGSAVGSGGGWVLEHADPFGGAHRYVGDERTADVLGVIGGVGGLTSLVGLGALLVTGLQFGTTQPEADPVPEWVLPTTLTGLGIIGLCWFYDAFHAPIAGRRYSKRARLLVAPDRLVLVCEF